jgi:uncharacterized delta-60 repeat protein
MAKLSVVFLLAILSITIAVATSQVQMTLDAPQQYGDRTNGARNSVPTADAHWAKTYGGTGSDTLIIRKTSDGGYIVAGGTSSFGTGAMDAWVMKLNSTGSAEWQKVYGGDNFDCACSVVQASDGGYIVAGYTASFGAGGYDFWVLKLDTTGSATWQKTYGTGDDEYALPVAQTSDGGYIVAGETRPLGGGLKDLLVLKLNSMGSVEWQKTYGGSASEWARSVVQTSDGGYAIAGYTNSFGAGGDDFWLLRLNSSGSIVWQKAYGGIYDDCGESMQQTSDGGYVVTGPTNLFGGGGDLLVLKLNSTGSVDWQKTYGGSGADGAGSAVQTSDGGYIVAGYTASFGAGGYDFWVLKLNPTGGVAWQETLGGADYDEGYSVQQTSDGGYIVAGPTNSFGAGGGDAWVVKLGVDGDIIWDTSSGASTQTTGVVPSDSSATTSETLATPADTVATVQDSLVTPQDTDALVVTQSDTTIGGVGGAGGGGVGGAVVVTPMVILSVTAGLVVLVVLAALVYVRQRRVTTGVPTARAGRTMRREENAVVLTARARATSREEGNAGVEGAPVRFPGSRRMRMHSVSAVALGWCPYCGAKVRIIGASFCWNCGASMGTDVEESLIRQEGRAVRAGKCMVCRLDVRKSDEIAWCPRCGNIAHKIHLLEWLHVKDRCPVCGEHLMETDLS